jgi:uncharacterized protein YbjT (DUF2867 family)
MQNQVLVTAANGVLGQAIVRAAGQARLPVLQAVRHPERANPNVESVRLDYADPTSIPPALTGVSAIVLMAPPLDPDAPAQLRPVLETARAAGVRHVVLISAFGVNHNEQAPLRVVEHLVIDSGVPFTILRPNFFMENFSQGSSAPGIREQNAIYLAGGDGKTSFISVQDIAEFAVAALQQSLTGSEFDLTGPVALDHTEVANIISQVSCRTVVYHALTEEQMLAGARSHGMPEPAVAYLGVLYGVVRAGFAAGVSRDFETIMERKPMTFEAFARSTAWN